jgi:hypothetical protein
LSGEGYLVYFNSRSDVGKINVGAKKKVAASVTATNAIKAATLMNQKVVAKSEIRTGAPVLIK